jgi:hypothetical protein
LAAPQFAGGVAGRDGKRGGRCDDRGAEAARRPGQDFALGARRRLWEERGVLPRETFRELGIVQ